MKLNRFLTEEEYIFLKKNKKVFVNEKKYAHGERGYLVDGCANWRKGKDDLNEEELELLGKIEKILKEVIAGFSYFSRFNNLEKELIRIEYDYNYNSKDSQFIGVGYVTLKELKEDFVENISSRT